MLYSYLFYVPHILKSLRNSTSRNSDGQHLTFSPLCRNEKEHICECMGCRTGNIKQSCQHIKQAGNFAMQNKLLIHTNNNPRLEVLLHTLLVIEWVQRTLDMPFFK